MDDCTDCAYDRRFHYGRLQWVDNRSTRLGTDVPAIFRWNHNGLITGERVEPAAKVFMKKALIGLRWKNRLPKVIIVIIQFAHNDEKNGGMDGDSVRAKTGDMTVDYRGTTPQGTYKEYLRRYVNETRALGATPILVSSMCRKYFSGNTIRRNGRHDLGDSFSIRKMTGRLRREIKFPRPTVPMDYPYAMKQVAEEMDVPFIDLTTKSASCISVMGRLLVRSCCSVRTTIRTP